MPYEPRMFERNPGPDTVTGIHPWDQPMNPRGDMPIRIPGIEPAPGQIRIEYENAQQAAQHYQRELAYRAQTGQLSRVAPAAATSTYAPPRQTMTPRNVVQNAPQPAIVPAKPTPQPPKTKYQPAKFLVIDSRVPSFANLWLGAGVRIAGMAFLTGLIFSFMLILAKGSTELSLLLLGMASSVLCWAVVVYRANTHSMEARTTEGSGPLWVGGWIILAIGVALYVANRHGFQVNILALVGLVSALTVNAMHDGVDGITEEVVKMRQTRRYFQGGPTGRKCQLCNSPAEDAVDMRRYRFQDPNQWRFYLPVCSKHQHYVCEIDGFGKETWPQSGDCTQPGLIRTRPRRFKR